MEIFFIPDEEAKTAAEDQRFSLTSLWLTAL